MDAKQMPTTVNMRASQASLADGSTSSYCPLTHHQYHYIQYPANYFQAPQPPTQSACQCPCSCGGSQLRLGAETRNSQRQLQPDSQVAVAVIVHQQAGGDQLPQPQTAAAAALKTAPSAQSLLNHSYQALQTLDAVAVASEQKRLNVVFDSSSCDCDLECTCGVAAASAAAAAAERALMLKHKQSNLIADAMLGADEITVSESDNNSTMIKKKKPRNATCCARDDAGSSIGAGALPEKNNCNEIYHDDELEATAYCRKTSSVSGVGDDARPPLPPRPPPQSATRPRSSATNSMSHRHGTGIKKYVVWCLICGGFSCLLGVLFLGVYFLLHSYTITVGNFETIPTFVPATLLILTGVCVMSLARRRNRYSYLIKLSGGCGLITALTCGLVTVTTTVLHMSRLQALRECEYAQKTRTCTCYSDMIESQVDRVDKEGVRLVFDSLSDCGVVHGSLYSCLRAIFGLSVAGVLISVFSCMLVYQLLSHERKKMYWEQLELRCRSLYASQTPPNMAAMAAAAASGRMVNCRCCEQCHAHRQLQLPMQPAAAAAAAYPWDDVVVATGGGGEQRFWATQPPGNFYSPNPGGEEHAANACRGHAARGAPNAADGRARSSGWSWPRMPWQRNTPVGGRRFRQAAATSPDSQYGFSSAADGNMLLDEPMQANAATTAAHGASFSVVSNGALPYGVWGPPPPYSDPNSPARRNGYYQYLQPNACLGANVAAAAERAPPTASSPNLHMEQRLGCQHQSTATLVERPDSALNNGSTACLTPAAVTGMQRSAHVKRHQHSNGKSKTTEYENTHTATTTPSDSDGCGNARERCANTLPTRKLKKRIEAGAKSIGPNNQQSTQRPNVQQVFACTNATNGDAGAGEAQPCGVMLTTAQQCAGGRANGGGGVENTAYQCSADSTGAITGPLPASGTTNAACAQALEGADVSESEVYFADVSSCCNMSVKNDNYYEDANQHHHHASRHHHQQQHVHPHQHQHQHQHQHSNCSHSSSSIQSNSNNAHEDYLAQRFGRRENSVRSRLPFPQARLNDDYEATNLNVPTLKNATMEQQQMQKDISRQSMCSVESEAKTEYTDLSPLTPCGGQLPPPPANFAGDKSPSAETSSLTHQQQQQQQQQQPQQTQSANFVASFPYSSESQCLEAHRRSTKNIHELMIQQESHYEIINDQRSSNGYAQGQAQHQQQQQQQSQQRPTNLHGHKSSGRGKSRSREQLDTGAAYQAEREREWSDGGGRTKRL